MWRSWEEKAKTDHNKTEKKVIDVWRSWEEKAKTDHNKTENKVRDCLKEQKT